MVQAARCTAGKEYAPRDDTKFIKKEGAMIGRPFRVNLAPGTAAVITMTTRAPVTAWAAPP